MMASLSFFVGEFENLPFSPGGGKSSSGLLIRALKQASAAGPKKKSEISVPAFFCARKTDAGLC